MGKTFRRGGNERGYYSPGKSLRDKRQRGSNRSLNEYDDSFQFKDKSSKKVNIVRLPILMRDGHEKDLDFIDALLDKDETLKESEELSFDDESGVDYDVDYTVQE